MATTKFEERLDKMIEAAKASDRPYKALEGKPFNLSASIARTLVVGSGLSKSSDEVREREAARLARWREQGGFTAPKKATEPTAKKQPAKKAAAKGTRSKVKVTTVPPEQVDDEVARRKAAGDPETVIVEVPEEAAS